MPSHADVALSVLAIALILGAIAYLSRTLVRKARPAKPAPLAYEVILAWEDLRYGATSPPMYACAKFRMLARDGASCVAYAEVGGRVASARAFARGGRELPVLAISIVEVRAGSWLQAVYRDGRAAGLGFDMYGPRIEVTAVDQAAVSAGELWRLRHPEGPACHQ